jgi:hypothetical protein
VLKEARSYALLQPDPALLEQGLLFRFRTVVALDDAHVVNLEVNDALLGIPVDKLLRIAVDPWVVRSLGIEAVAREHGATSAFCDVEDGSIRIRNGTNEALSGCPLEPLTVVWGEVEPQRIVGHRQDDRLREPSGPLIPQAHDLFESVPPSSVTGVVEELVTAYVRQVDKKLRVTVSSRDVQGHISFTPAWLEDKRAKGGLETGARPRSLARERTGKWGGDRPG